MGITANITHELNPQPCAARSPHPPRLRSYTETACFMPAGSAHTIAIESVTRATKSATVIMECVFFISIHFPCGTSCQKTARRSQEAPTVAPRAGRDPDARPRHFVSRVSIHAPRAGRDTGTEITLARRTCFNPRAPRGARPGKDLSRGEPDGFQSTRPARGATQVPPLDAAPGLVSIHAPRAGRDASGRDGTTGRDGFNPRAPRGARPTSTP